MCSPEYNIADATFLAHYPEELHVLPDNSMLPDYDRAYTRMDKRGNSHDLLDAVKIKRMPR